jgi:3-dehydroquinate synthetase
VTELLARLGLPDGLAALRARSGARLAPEELRAGMRHDKKGRASKPAFVLVRGLGDLVLDQELDERALAELLL